MLPGKVRREMNIEEIFNIKNISFDCLLVMIIKVQK
jgi:hypothetical protein